MIAKIPITKGVIRAARLGNFPGGPLALGILLKNPGVHRVYVDGETIKVLRDGGHVEVYVMQAHLDGWLQLFNLGENVPAGVLCMGRVLRRGGCRELCAFFSEFDMEPTIEVYPWGPVLSG